MDRSFPRADRPAIPQRGQFAGETSSAPRNWGDASARRRYIEAEEARFDKEARQHMEARAASRRRFTDAMESSMLLPFYDDPKHAPKKTPHVRGERLDGRAERLIVDSMNEELDVLEESLIRLRAGSDRKETGRVPSYVSRWGRQVDAMDTSEIDSFSPRTLDEQRWKASGDFVVWKDLFKDDPVSPPLPESRSRGHHPVQKPRHKDIDRSYSLRPSWERDVSDEELDQEIDDELEALLAKRRQRRM